MLNLAQKQLLHDWVIVTDGAADLSIYSFDSEEGRQAWQRHGEGASALLSAIESTNETVDLILKKPLRSKNFSTALNSISTQLDSKLAKDHIAPIAAATAITQTKAKSPSLFKTLSKHFKPKNKPANDLPTLNLSLPELDEIALDTILKPSQLQHWLTESKNQDSDTFISAILGNLLPLNRSSISSHKRLELLELYRQAIHHLLFKHDPRYAGQNQTSHTHYLQTVHALNLLIKELSIGYQIIVNQAYQQGLRPQSDTFFLNAINRLAETTSLSILHAYHYYLSPPSEAVACLHQLYIYCEASDTLQTVPSSKLAPTSISFSHIYKQIMLTAIADPYRLTQAEIVDLYTLMGRYAENINIKTIAKTTDNTMTSGHFYLDCGSDTLPTSFANISIEKQHILAARLLDTHAVLKAIEIDLNPNSDIVIQHEHKVPDLGFLKKITPQINATYQRQFERIPTVENTKLSLALGIKRITQGLNNNDRSQCSQWTIHNRGMGGMMVSCDEMDCYQLNIGDFIGVFENDKAPAIAVIRWLHTHTHSTSMGLERYNAIPVAMTVTTDNANVFSAILLSNDKNAPFEHSLIVEQALYSPGLSLQITTEAKTSTITLDKLIQRSARYEQFSFKLQSSS